MMMMGIFHYLPGHLSMPIQYTGNSLLSRLLAQPTAKGAPMAENKLHITACVVSLGGQKLGQ